MASKRVFLTIVLAVTAGLCGAPGARAKDDDPPANQEELKRYLAIMEKIDVDAMLKNDRLMAHNVKCFLNEGPCSSQFRDIKKMLPILVKDSCASCTKEQKKLVKKSMDAMKSQRPDDYEKLRKYFDPEGIYEKKFLENIKE